MLQWMQYLILVPQLFAICTQSVSIDFKRLTSLLKGLLEASSNSHYLTNRLHLQSQLAVASREFIKIPSRDFYNDIIQCRLKECRCWFCDLILQLIQMIPNGQLRGDLSNRITCCLRCQCRWSWNARIDFNSNNVLLIIRTNRKLHIASTRKISDGTHHFDGHITHLLVGGITQSHCGRYCNTVPSMNTNGIKILNATYDGYIVIGIAKQL